MLLVPQRLFGEREEEEIQEVLDMYHLKVSRQPPQGGTGGRQAGRQGAVPAEGARSLWMACSVLAWLYSATCL